MTLLGQLPVCSPDSAGPRSEPYRLSDRSDRTRRVVRGSEKTTSDRSDRSDQGKRPIKGQKGIGLRTRFARVAICVRADCSSLTLHSLCEVHR